MIKSVRTWILYGIVVRLSILSFIRKLSLMVRVNFDFKMYTEISLKVYQNYRQLPLSAQTHRLSRLVDFLPATPYSIAQTVQKQQHSFPLKHVVF